MNQRMIGSLLVIFLFTQGCTESKSPGRERDVGVDAPIADATKDATGDSDATDGVFLDTGDTGDTGSAQCTTLAEAHYDYLVAPTGQPDAAGTSEAPLDLATALSNSGPVSPGDRVGLKAGTYSDAFVSDLAGTADNPIIIEAEPGARVLLDSAGQDAESGLVIHGERVEYRGLELTNSGLDRQDNLSGVTIYGPNTKLINSVIHNTAQGISFWTPAVDSELYGNIWFRTGASRPESSIAGTSDGCLVGGLQPVARTRFIGNHSWGPELSSRNLRLGWGGAVQNEDVTLIDNYLIGRINVQGDWLSGTIHGNSFYSEISGIHSPTYPDNSYADQLPTGSKIVVQSNEYDPHRAEVIIYNWDDTDSVAVDLSEVLEEGAPFEIFSVFDLFGDPVVSGTYEGITIEVPMGTVDPPQPTGAPEAIVGADDPGKTFGVFIVRWQC